MTINLIKQSDRILVAGASGMAGSAITRALKRNGYGDTNQGGALLTPKRKELDLLDDKKVYNWMSEHKPDVVVLAAATVGGIEANRSRPTDFLLQNLRIETNVIESAWRRGTRRLLFLGSSCIYPKYAAQPIREESLLTGELEPTNEWYAIAKIAGIKLCDALRMQNGFDAISLMPTNLYGPGDNYHPSGSHVMPAMLRRFHEAKITGKDKVTCWGTGSPFREFLHADDLGNACVFALEKWTALDEYAPRNDNGEPLGFLNVGTGIDITIGQLAKKVADVVGFKGLIEWDHNMPDGTPRKQLNVSRINKMGWKAEIKLTDGINMAYNDFKRGIAQGTIRE